MKPTREAGWSSQARSRASSSFLEHSSGGEQGARIGPPPYGIDFVDVHAAAARGTRGAGAPLPHRDAIQRSFGRHDVSGVRAYTGAAAAEASRAMGAQAFTVGSKVAFARTPSLHLAAHEAAHAMQQRAGVHLKGGVGEAGDPHERQADAVAERVVRGESAQSVLDSIVRGPAAGAPAVQRSVGFEVEMREPDWNIWHAPKSEEEEAKPRPPAKGTPIIHGNKFQLQAEYGGGNIALAEMVTNPPGLRTRAEFKESMEDMVRLAKELDKKKEKQVHSAGDFKGGDPAFRMKKTREEFEGASMQVTAGVPLGSVGALFQNIENLESVAGKREEYTKARQRADYVATKSGRSSNEFKGLMVLLQQYLHGLHAGGAATQSFVKGMVRVMARTDFHAMFELLPEADRKYIRGNLKNWVDYLLSGKHKRAMFEARLPGTHLVTPTLYDKASGDPAMQIRTTREAWLRALPERDLLSYQGRGEDEATVSVFPGVPGNLGEPKSPAAHAGGSEEKQGEMKEAIKSLYMGLGSLAGGTDFIRYTDDEVKDDAVADVKKDAAPPILEIRNPPPLKGVSAFSLFKSAEAIYHAVEDAIRYPGGHGTKEKPAAPRNFVNVFTQEQKQKRAAAEAQAAELEKRVKEADKILNPQSAEKSQVGEKTLVLDV